MGDYVLICDNCETAAEERFDSFEEAAEWRKANGWKVQKDQYGNWINTCPECQSGGHENDLLNIPAHKNCTNCGACCGVIPASPNEIKTIKAFLADHPTEKAHAVKNSMKLHRCPFRDNKQKKCIIYPVRPVVCQLLGVVAGMQCKHGNSMEIDGDPFMQNIKLSEAKILNLMDWTKIENGDSYGKKKVYRGRTELSAGELA
jgi:Fe-S-cluster containining protein